jgi:hypothetical protein
VQRERDRESGGRRGEGEEAEGEACRGESAGGGRVAGRERVAAAGPRAEAEAEAAAVAVPPVRRRLKLEQQLGHPGHGLAHLARSNRGALIRGGGARRGEQAAWRPPIGCGAGVARLRPTGFGSEWEYAGTSS